MRPLLQFAGFCFIVFFIVGEFQGWYAGVVPQTPMYLYKMDKTVNVVRDVRYRDELPLSLKGRVQDGDVLVEIFFEIPASFQASTAGVPPKLIYSEEFYIGQQINLVGNYAEGKGRYTIRIRYNDSSGIYKLSIPNEKQL